MQSLVQLVILSLSFSFGCCFGLSDVIVTTKYGKIRGVTSSKSHAFLGVPFAEAPVGKLRWKNPEDPKSWGPTVYDATAVKPGCPQKGCESMNPKLVCPTETSEDCLYLYIWTPLGANSTTSFPVMIYIHGGNFVHMSADSLLFDGENFVNKGQVILVSIEYRLGALGFLLTPDTPTEKGATGNYGILDQRQALKWVKENIKSFGGNPEQVTLFGQSAGGQSTLAHMMTKESSQYFQRAIIESAPIGLPWKNRQEMLFLSNMLADQLNCTAGNLKCLYNKTADEITTAQKAIRKYPSSLKLLDFFEPWLPYVDGVVIPSQILESFSKGFFIDKPIMIGSVTEETRIFIYEGFTSPLNEWEYMGMLALTFTNNALSVLIQYPPEPSKYPDERNRLQIPSTDFIFTCTARNYSRNAYLKNGGKVWYYSYDHAFSFKGWGNFTFCQDHVCHGSEIPILFDTAPLGNFTMTADEVKLSNNLITYFTNFAKSSDPNVGVAPSLKWPLYTPESNSPYMHFATPSDAVGNNYKKSVCDFWDTVGYDA